MLTAILILIFIIGAALGSFISVMVYRLHREEASIIRGRSHCPACKMQLKPLDMIPLVSYLVLRGKCRNCDKEISYSYPLLELITGVIFVALFLKFPFLTSALAVDYTVLGLYLLHAFYSVILIFTFFYDLQYMIVADSILLPGIIVGLIATVAAPLTPNIFDALIGLAIGVGFFGLQFILSKGTWIGAGDIRVGALMGVILGWKLTIVALIVAYLVGSVVSTGVYLKTKKLRGVRIPFAPLLVTGTFVSFFVGSRILSWYLGRILGV